MSEQRPITMADIRNIEADVLEYVDELVSDLAQAQTSTRAAVAIRREWRNHYRGNLALIASQAFALGIQQGQQQRPVEQRGAAAAKTTAPEPTCPWDVGDEGA
jgi:hypothetical protein